MQPSTMPPPAQELLGHLSAKADAGDGLAWLVASPLFKKNRESVIYRQTEKVLPVKYHEVSSWISIVDIFKKMAPCWMKHGCAMEKLSKPLPSFNSYSKTSTSAISMIDPKSWSVDAAVIGGLAPLWLGCRCLHALLIAWLGIGVSQLEALYNARGLKLKGKA